MDTAEYYSDLLRPVFKGRRIILIGSGPLMAQMGVAHQLRALGAERPFVLASMLGMGTPPPTKTRPTGR